ncbi:hypothetical protein TraAM80_09946 [Trypanosoma rangeli]|uniref:Uncharacterized protein n=1 Tax=Trypanosoma rangeli TaxID=5698 RepID=A0A3R7N473_TRYRA|nr:uncharacterized protein TraAM80_09946 [Trypanosoma rangeli]RNE96149.1 hypothetical protein TraAM80_09946 [Trypanosoma rangeli]|eukprot:RNE96149.1 hypothetical protein TraAM80_09946 [Trypanosoma rangeli]
MTVALKLVKRLFFCAVWERWAMKAHGVDWEDRAKCCLRISATFEYHLRDDMPHCGLVHKTLAKAGDVGVFFFFIPWTLACSSYLLATWGLMSLAMGASCHTRVQYNLCLLCTASL